MQKINFKAKICGWKLKLKQNLTSELKIKVVWNTCDKELGAERKSVNDNYFKSSLENFQKSLTFI